MGKGRAVTETLSANITFNHHKFTRYRYKGKNSKTDRTERNKNAERGESFG
jgi:hypothetical protein